MTNRILAALLALPMAAGPPANAVAQDLGDICNAEDACRHIESYDFEGRDGESFSVPAGIDLPWIAQGNVVMTPGEAVAVRLVETDGQLVPQLMRTGDDARDAQLGENEILFDFSEHETGVITLTVRSTFPEMLEYAALMVTINNGPSRTSVCTLMPGVQVFERWQDPIYQLALWNFRPAAGYGCSVIDMDASIGTASAD